MPIIATMHSVDRTGTFGMSESRHQHRGTDERNG
jgi:hypothetical protein